MRAGVAGAAILPAASATYQSNNMDVYWWRPSLAWAAGMSNSVSVPQPMLGRIWSTILSTPSRSTRALPARPARPTRLGFRPGSLHNSYFTWYYICMGETVCLRFKWFEGFQGLSPVPGGVAGHLVEPAEHYRSTTTLLSGDVTTVCNTLFIYQ